MITLVKTTTFHQLMSFLSGCLNVPKHVQPYQELDNSTTAPIPSTMKTSSSHLSVSLWKAFPHTAVFDWHIRLEEKEK
jgi:hypothetical protein